MRKCHACGNLYDKTFEVIMNSKTYIFDCFECAIHVLAPKCVHCQCKVIGHGVEDENEIFCCAHCAKEYGVQTLKDRA